MSVAIPESNTHVYYSYGLEAKKTAEIARVGSAGAGLTAILLGASLPIVGSVIGLIASVYMIVKNYKINKNITEDYFLNSKKDDTLEVACKYDWLNDQYKTKLPKYLVLNDYGEKLTEYMKNNSNSKIAIKKEVIENIEQYLLYDLAKEKNICKLSLTKYINKLRQKYKIPALNSPAEEAQEPSAPPVQEPQNPVNDEEETEDLESLIPQALVMQPQTSSHKNKQKKWKKKKINSSLEKLIQDNTSEIKKLSETLESQTESLKKLGEKYESQTESLKKLEEQLSKDLEEKYESQTEILKKLGEKLSKDLEEFGTEYESFKTDITTKWKEQKKSYDEAFETNDLSYKSLLEFVGNEELKTKLESVDNFCVKLPKIEEILSSLNEVSSKIEPLKDLMGIFNEHDLWKKKINKQLEVYKEKITALETQNSSQQQSD
jgi:hypothetical protein